MVVILDVVGCVYLEAGITGVTGVDFGSSCSAITVVTFLFGVG